MENEVRKNKVNSIYSNRVATFLKLHAFREIVSRIGFSKQNCAITKNSNCHLRKSYIKWKDKDRFKVGDYSFENGNAAVIKNFHQQFPGLRKSTVETFEQKVEKKLNRCCQIKMKLKIQSQRLKGVIYLVRAQNFPKP